MATVKMENIEKTYPNGFKAIHGVDVEIGDGELIVLVGPSGCGKSTLMRMIAGLESVTAGNISIDGRVVNELEPADRDIAMVFQNYALYPHMNVFDNMAYGLKIRRVPRDEIRQRVDKAAAILELTQDQLTRKPRELSGGQRQRVAMGRAIVRQPSVFLFDEPLSYLDAKLRVQMRIEIKLLQEQLGADTLVHGYFGENRTDMKIRLGGIRAFNSGEVLPVRVSADKIHLFAPDTEKRL